MNRCGQPVIHLVGASLAAVLIVQAVTVAASQHEQSGQSTQVPPQTGPPEFLDITELGLGKRATIVLVFGAQCQACTDALPFYKRLAAETRNEADGIRFVVLAVGGSVPVGRLLRKSGLSVDGVTSYPRLSKLREISGDTPGVLVVDENGKPLGRWQGPLTSAQEKEVEALVEKYTKKSPVPKI